MAKRNRPAKGTSKTTTEQNDRAVYKQFAARSDFAELRHHYRRFAFPATLAFMVWYVTYVICNNWARDFMDTQVIGHINIAVVFGLLQFLSTFVIAYLYARHANRALDPLAGELRDDFDRQTGRSQVDRVTGR
jgi:uncharacterized membrane protein (DUF485 family)